MSDPIIKCESFIFSKLFYTGKFEVPWHQRKYDWEKEHVSDLLDDISEAVQQTRESYFLGSIILVEKDESNVWEINDGQQRMVTFSLICACFCRLFSQRKDTRREGLSLRVTFDLDVNHTSKLSDAEGLSTRVLPPRHDKSRYGLLVKGKDIGANGKLSTAWKEIEKKVNSMGMEDASVFFDFLMNKIEVACLKIPRKKVDPNAVFETINCRGKQLEDFDLIRNDLYSYFNSEDAASRRDAIHDNLENFSEQIGSDKKAAEYSRMYLQCVHGYLPKDKFYRKARNAIRVQSDSVVKKGGNSFDYVYNLVDELTSSQKVSVFNLVKLPDSSNPFMDAFLQDSRTRNKARGLGIFLHELKRYSIAQTVIFAFLCRYIQETDGNKRKEVARIIYRNMKNFVSFVMRTALVAGKFEPSHFESEFSDFAHKIWSMKRFENIGNETDRLLEEWDRESIMNDAKFVEKVKILDIKASDKAIAFLFSLNYQEQQDRELLNYGQCTLEHILPKSEKFWDRWEGFEGGNSELIDPKDWISRLGNLTILGKSDNKPGQKENSDFFSKKPFLTRSALSLNGYFSEIQVWSPEEIGKRQNRLANLAKTVWSFN